tara:strand:+ start:1824 stop:2678 length:855 start_codon:yes stop_codon:yes gene_type:complete
MIIGRISDARLAQAFVDYMKVQHIDISIIQEDHHFALVVHKQEDVDQAQQEWHQFVKQPEHPRYRIASWHQGNTGTQFKNPYQSTSLWQNIKGQSGLFTQLVMGLSILLFLGMKVGLGYFIFNALGFFKVISADSVVEFWRFITPNLLHFSILHLVFNILWWWQLAGQIEQKLGSSKIVELFLTTGLMASLTQFFVADSNFGGLSGVVYGLLGYFFVLQWMTHQRRLYLPHAYFGFMFFWLILGFTDLLGIAVANGVHVGGLCCGMIQGYIDCKKGLFEKDFSS